MPSNSLPDFKLFAERVERLCEFLLGQDLRDTEGRRVISELKEEAADIQDTQCDPSISFSGLDNYMRGMPNPKES